MSGTFAPVIPTEVHGFGVTVGVGTYPPDRPQSLQRAMYAELFPTSAENRERMRRAGKERIVASIPLTPEGARDIESDPNGRLAELAAQDALREALRLARLVDRA